MYKAKVDELEECIEIRKQYASTETNMKMAYRKCMLKTADMFESADDELLKDLVSSAVIACFDAEEKIKSTLTSNNSKDTAKQTIADLGAKPTRRGALETVVEEDEEAQPQNTLKNDGDLDSDPSVEVVASSSPPSPSPSPKSPSPKSPRKPSSKTTRSPKKKCPGTPPLSPRKACVM
jgi:hypothetical protein